jgi:predicted transposase YdaD
VTYQAILREGKAEGIAEGKAEGKAEEARRMLLLFGRDILGDASEAVQNQLEAMADVNRLEQLARRVKDAGSWEELLGMQAPRRRSSRRKSSS